jgi:hypothetical protein
MAAKKNYHKPAEDPRTIGGGLKAAGRERREKLSMIINTTLRHTRNDLMPSMELQTLAIKDLTMPKHMVRKLDPGHIKEVANGIQPMGFSGDQGRARRRSAECSLRKRSPSVQLFARVLSSRLDLDRIIASDQGAASKSQKHPPSPIRA